MQLKAELSGLRKQRQARRWSRKLTRMLRAKHARPSEPSCKSVHVSSISEEADMPLSVLSGSRVFKSRPDIQTTDWEGSSQHARLHD